MINGYFIFILIVIIGFFVLDTVSEILNLRALQKTLPEPFRDVFDEERYRKSQEYTRVNTWFGLMTSILDLIILLLFWFLGGFNFVDQLVRELGWNPVLTGLLFFGVLLLGKKILDLPFELYDTFVIEERFGFNKTTPATFWSDQVKGLLVGGVIGAILGAIIIAFFQYGGDLAWLWAWIAATVLSLLLTYLAPTVIMPLFNKFEPLEEGELRERIMDYAGKVDFGLAEVQVMDGSKRSSKSNAFFTGFGKNRKVALFDTLIEKHTVPELVGVFAHEVGHFKKKHIPRMIAFSILNMGVMLFLAGLFINNEPLHAAFRMEQTSVYASLLFFGLLYIPVSRILGTLAAIWSRKNEFEADEFAAKTTGSAQPLIDALKKLSKDNLSNLTPHPFYVFLNYSHPPMLRRLRALEQVDPEGDATATTTASS